MTATLHHIRPAEPDPLAELHAERERLGRELDRFAVVDERHSAAEARLAEIDAAMGALDRADCEAVETWAAAAEGEPPAPLLAERKALLARRLDVEAERQGAEIAVAAVLAKRTSIIHAMNAVGARIRERQVVQALDEARRVHGEALALAADVGLKMMRLEGLRQALTDGQGEAAKRRDQSQEATFRAALGEVEKCRLPSLMADPATVARFAAEWKGALR
jgi:DNA repair exonuclease SbcCD ATPase subunit